jgi:hypothetical protein
MGHPAFGATPLPSPRRALLAAEIADVVAFLKTLDDGFAP